MKETAGPLQMESGDLITCDMEEDEGLHDFFILVFIG